MAYIPYTYVPIGPSGTKKARFTLPDYGVKLSDDGGVIPDGKCERLVNIDIKNGRIETRKVQNTNLNGFCADGNFNGRAKELFCGHIVFHVGTRLYTYSNKHTAPVCIAEGLPDKKSLMCDFMSGLYVYCDTHIYKLDADFVLTEQEPTAVKLYTGVNAAIPGTGTRLDTPFNIFSPRIIVEFTQTANEYFNLPRKLDITRPYQVYKNGVLLDKSMYTMQEELFRLHDTSSYVERSVSITYYLKEPETEGFERVAEGCDIVCSFGGNATGGTRLFFTGNPDKKGYYYKSEFQDPLYCASDNYEIIGDGSSNITCLKKMYGNLLVFTDSSVYRMGYTLTKDGPFFSVKQISDYVGCDCPESVQLIDNRVVFLNSERGVFIVDSTDEAGEHNIKPLSGNILRGHAMGILDVDAQALRRADSCDFDRKYMLFADNRAYIWDYDKTAFYENSSYSKAQDRLCWYIYDSVEGDFFYDLGGHLVSLSVGGDGTMVNAFSPDEANCAIESVMESGNIEMFADGKRRFVTGLSIRLSRSKNCSITLECMSDGVTYFRKALKPCVSSKEKLVFSLPEKALYDFGFKITANGKFAIYGIDLFSREISE